GGRSHLPGARHGGGARSPRENSGGAGFGDAVSGIHRQHRARPLSPFGVAGSPRRRRIAPSDSDRLAPRQARAPAMAFAEFDPPGQRNLGGAGSGDSLSQSPRLCAADSLSGLRAPDAMPELHHLAGGASLFAAAAMPSLRLSDPDAEGLSRLPA